MKTVSEHVERFRALHHKALESLNKGKPQSGLQLWRKLRRIESEASSFAVAMCNTGRSDEQVEAMDERIRGRIERTLGKLPVGFFFNKDPRGYALKIDNEVAEIPAGMHKDWGGYGILAPEIN